VGAWNSPLPESMDKGQVLVLGKKDLEDWYRIISENMTLDAMGKQDHIY
jgi:hypothetical protein